MFCIHRYAFMQLFHAFMQLFHAFMHSCNRRSNRMNVLFNASSLEVRCFIIYKLKRTCPSGRLDNLRFLIFASLAEDHDKHHIFFSLNIIHLHRSIKINNNMVVRPVFVQRLFVQRFFVKAFSSTISSDPIQLR